MRSAIEAFASDARVLGLGIRPGDEKIAVNLRASDGVGSAEVPVLITITENPIGVWRVELKALGVVVGDWRPEWRAHCANVRKDSLETVADADFVVAIVGPRGRQRVCALRRASLAAWAIADVLGGSPSPRIFG